MILSHLASALRQQNRFAARIDRMDGRRDELRSADTDFKGGI